MSPELLRRAGVALHGTRWQQPLARRLGIHFQSLRRYADGDRPIPPELAGRLLPLMLERDAEVHDIIDELRRAMRDAA